MNKMTIGEMQQAEQARVSALITAEQAYQQQEYSRRAMTGLEDAARAKLPRETWGQYGARIAEMDIARQGRCGPLVTPEAEQHGDYQSRDVLHAETNTIAVTRRNMMTSPFDLLLTNGTITIEQHEAAGEIAAAAERIQSAVSVRGGSIVARVDNSGAGRDFLLERLADVHLEIAYTRWRSRLPMPRRLYLDMIQEPGSLKGKARAHNVGWPKARKNLIAALDRWIEIRQRITRDVEREEVEIAQARVGGGKVV